MPIDLAALGGGGTVGIALGGTIALALPKRSVLVIIWQVICG